MQNWRTESFENGVHLALQAKNSGQSAIIKIRHGKTEPSGCLTKEFRGYFVKQGVILGDRGLRFDRVVTSGEPRAIGSVLATCEGAGHCPRMRTDERLRPVEREPGFDKPAFKAEAAKHGAKPWVCLNTEPKYQDMVHRAGQDAATVDLECAERYAGQIVGQGVHQGYQVEKGIQHLENPGEAPYPEPPTYFDDGQIGCLILDRGANFVDFFFFPAPVEYFKED